MRKNLLCLLLILAMSMSLFACSGTPESTTEPIDNFTYSYADHVLTVTGSGALLDRLISSGEDFSSEDVYSIVIETGCTEIGTGVFFGFLNVSSITLPNGLVKMSNEVFNSRELTSVTIPSTVSEITGNPFTSCEKLVSIANESPYFTVENGVLFSKDKTRLVCCPASISGNYSIPDSVTEIGAYAFDGCKNLVSVNIPYSVVFIEDYAFSNCDGLASIAIPGSIKTIGTGAYFCCDNLETLTLHKGTEEIEDSAFRWCGLESVIVPNSVKAIGENAFEGTDLLYYGGRAEGSPWGADAVSPYSVEMFGNIN